MFLRELNEKHDVDDAEFLVDGAPWLQAGLFELGMHFRHETFGERNPVKRIFQEIKKRTEQSIIILEMPNQLLSKIGCKRSHGPKIH